MPDEKRPDDELDPGAYIGREPEREGETDVSDVVEGEVGSAKLVEPSAILDRGAEHDAFPGGDLSDASPAEDR